MSDILALLILTMTESADSNLSWSPIHPMELLEDTGHSTMNIKYGFSIVCSSLTSRLKTCRGVSRRRVAVVAVVFQSYQCLQKTTITNTKMSYYPDTQSLHCRGVGINHSKRQEWHRFAVWGAKNMVWNSPSNLWVTNCGRCSSTINQSIIEDDGISFFYISTVSIRQWFAIQSHERGLGRVSIP